VMTKRIRGIDGYEATRRLKANAVLQAIPIIAVTSYALGGDADKSTGIPPVILTKCRLTRGASRKPSTRPLYSCSSPQVGSIMHLAA
jgi:CheY-like chemotaxis protein